ncbi:unnamed protein product [Prorocentrum cordatum]|uniref:Uncharacterized protein n=1 Tax=Prorocentrum cordatum TaxID=2364126 RepID=A0ABN9T8A3_9DINO|nr:unnamed protein product [Polarella glacialis]
MFLNRRREHAASSELAALMSSPNQPLALRLRGRPHGEDAGSGGAQRVSQAPELSYLPRPKTGMRVQEERMEGRQEGRKERGGGGGEEEGRRRRGSSRATLGDRRRCTARRERRALALSHLPGPKTGMRV